MKCYKLLIITYLISILSSCTSKPPVSDPQSVATPNFITSISGSLLLGLKLATQNKAKAGKIPLTASNCITSLESSYFDATIAPILDVTFTVYEKTQIEEFLATPTGLKWVLRELLMTYVQFGYQPPEPLPIFSKEDLKKTSKFFRSSAGKKMIESVPVIRTNLQLTIEPKLIELISRCKQGQPIPEKKHNTTERAI